MLEIDFDRLRPIGLTPAIAQALWQVQENGESHASPDSLRAVRVTQVQREMIQVHDGATEFGVHVIPALLRPPTAREALAVGDWGVVRIDAQGRWLVACIAPLTQLVRRAADGGRQAIVHNVDTAFLLMGLDADFNPRRIERYLALVQPAGIWPVIVLTKFDCVMDPSPRIDALRARIPADVAVVAVDATSPAAATTLAPYLDAGRTVVLLGSSGSGKSTLTNTLAGSPLQATGAVREGDSRGRHTTTTRTLRVLPDQACVIDTPGLRGLRPEIDVDELSASFRDIDALGQQCRFRDCRHREEPGCAVRVGVDADRLANFHKLQRELRRDQMNPLARQQWLQQVKVRARALRAREREQR